MTVIREKQMVAWANRLMQTPDSNIFDGSTPEQVQLLWENSYEFENNPNINQLINLEAAKQLTMNKLLKEVHFLSLQEHTLIEQLLLSKGKIRIIDWEEAIAAESLMRRLWCNITIENGNIQVYLPVDLHQPIQKAMDTSEHKKYREKIFHFEATVNGLLYLTGYMYIKELLQSFKENILKSYDREYEDIALRYFKASFEYMFSKTGEIILLHPGLAEPEQIIDNTAKSNFEVLEFSTDMLAGAMNELLPEEEKLHRHMVASLSGNVRPEYDAREIAKDLRFLAKQGAPIEAMQEVLEVTYMGYPNKESLLALEELKKYTPSWNSDGSFIKH